MIEGGVSKRNSMDSWREVVEQCILSLLLFLYILNELEDTLIFYIVHPCPYYLWPKFFAKEKEWIYLFSEKQNQTKKQNTHTALSVVFDSNLYKKHLR